jgi:hypothetical protein
MKATQAAGNESGSINGAERSNAAKTQKIISLDM